MPCLPHAGMLLLTPFEARAISWSVPSEGGDGSGGASSGALSMQSLRLLARWRLDSGDAGIPTDPGPTAVHMPGPGAGCAAQASHGCLQLCGPKAHLDFTTILLHSAGEVGFAEAKRAARQLPPRGLCAAWAWDAPDHSSSPAAAAQQEPGSGSDGGGSKGSGGGGKDGGGGHTWMAMDVPANLAAAGLPAALAMAGLGGAGSSSGWQQEAQKRALALPRLLVVDSEGCGKRCGPDGVRGAAVCAVGRLLLPVCFSGGRRMHRGSVQQCSCGDASALFSAS